ncbi:lysozyme C-like isoform X2 [Montipora capricornis]
MKIVHSFAMLLILSAFGGLSYAGTKSKCDVVRALRTQNVPDSDMRDWLCLVQHESGYRYNAFNDNGWSQDLGIFQINNHYWCGKGNVKYSACWRILTHGCGVSNCNDFMDSDISDDTECAVKIKNCSRDGFSRWAAWRKHCRGKNLQSKSQYDFSGC